MKKTNLFEKFNKVFYALLILTAVSFTACDDTTEDPEPTGDIVTTLTDLGGYDSLIKYVSVYPDLVTTLNNSESKTLFAPNNQAFEGLLETPGFPQDLRAINPAIIKNVLTYHVVLGSEVTSSELTGEITTAYEDEVIEVNADGTLKTGSSNQAITLGDTDIQTTSGLIHEVNSVLIPPSVGTTLTPILGTVAGTVLLGADFSDLATALQRVDAARAERGDTPFSNILADRSGSYTVFAPINQVFEGAQIDPATADVAFLEAVIANHVVVGENLSAADIQTQLGGGDNTLTTVGGEVVVAPTEFMGSATLSIGSAPVVSPDNVAGNGTVHAVAGFVSSAVNAYSTVLLGAQGNAEEGFYDAISNTRYSYAGARDASGGAAVDFAYYYGNSNENSLGAIDSDDLHAVYNSVELPIEGIFGTRNATRFQVTELGPDEFNAVTSNSGIIAIANSELTSEPDATNLTVGNVVAFRLDASRGSALGLIHIAEVNDTNGEGSITINVKVVGDTY